MLDIQLGRRNLSPIQRIVVAEKYRPIYEKQAKENVSKAIFESNKRRSDSSLVNLPKLETKPINTSEKLAMTEEFKKEIALENEKKKSEAGKNYGKGMTNSSTPIGVNLSTSKSESDRKDTWTDSQTAKKAGVGVGNLSYGNTNPNNAKLRLSM